VEEIELCCDLSSLSNNVVVEDNEHVFFVGEDNEHVTHVSVSVSTLISLCDVCNVKVIQKKKNCRNLAKLILSNVLEVQNLW
jgi:predicted ATP-dependent Lon-type protease